MSRRDATELERRRTSNRRPIPFFLRFRGLSVMPHHDLISISTMRSNHVIRFILIRGPCTQMLYNSQRAYTPSRIQNISPFSQ